MQHLNISYSDILMMPTNERRFHLGLLVKNKTEEKERFEDAQKNHSSKSKGERRTTISGDTLKNKLKSGEIPT